MTENIWNHLVCEYSLCEIDFHESNHSHSHDYEVLEKIRRAYQENSITLLEDDQTIIEIERWTQLSGEKSHVQIIGSSFSFAAMESSTRHIQELCNKFPRVDANTPRILLIHNPSMLSALDTKDSCDIVFSGHLRKCGFEYESIWKD